uniref:Tetratricopeptide repeat protein 22-like n=1 Tax=Phallusia mammillata TaxID=59560 RepID=A0A6F9DW19_9ASCI|nr:tetratricopeptide repeat protein 22-like [Phallusia mammillata]
MDDVIEYDDYRPGHFHLRLNVNDCEAKDIFDNSSDSVAPDSQDAIRREKCLQNARLRDLTFRYQSLASDLQEEDVPDQTAARNLMGLLAFRLDKLPLAVEHFRSVIDEDDENVNALQNLAQSYSKMNNPEQAESLSQKVRHLLGRGEIPVKENSVNHVMARSLAGHAYTYAYDVGLNDLEEQKERLFASIRTYDRAMNIGASSILLEERRRWYFVMATIFIRLDTLMTWSRDSEKARLPGFNRAVNLLKEVSKSDRLYHRVLSWAYLGVLMERQSTFDTTPMAIHDCGYTGTDPLDCYSKAIQLAEGQTNVLNRLAKVFQVMGKHELAVGTSSMSIETTNCNPLSNVSPLHCRARVYTAMYMRDLKRSKMGSSTMPERTLLEKAKLDLDQVISARPLLRAYMDIGQVCYYMGVDAIKESFVVNEDNLNKALIYFAKALDCELGALIPELQLLRGKCLRIKGEERNALECFKRAIELDREGSKSTQAFRCLMETLVQWYCQGGPSKRDVIIADADQWIQLALNKFDNDVIVSELRSLSHVYTHETLELCKGMIKSGKMALARLCFSMFPAPTATD